MRKTTFVPGLTLFALAVGALAGCSGGDNDIAVTTTSIDQQALAREQMCEAMQAYADQEDAGQPRAPVTNLDQSGPTTTAAPRTDPRLARLERLEASLTEDVPADARAALAEMKVLRSRPIDDSKAPDPAEPTIDVVLPPLFDALDPICATRNGRDPQSGTTTTLSGRAATTAPATPTTAPATTAAATATTAAAAPTTTAA